MATCAQHDLNYGNRDRCPACVAEGLSRLLECVERARLSPADMTMDACPCCGKAMSAEVSARAKGHLDNIASAALEDMAKALAEVDAIRDRHRTTCPVDRAPDEDNAAVRLEDEYIRR